MRTFPDGQEQGGQNYAYLYDGKGNVTGMLDSSQAVAATYTYDAFGTLMSQTGSLSQPFKFSTKMYEPETGLSYFGYRFYSPALGRWMTRDPIGYAGGLNLYGFVGNDPTNFFDVFGLYYKDVHLNLTYQLAALEVGIDPFAAEIIAFADQSVDEGWTYPGIPIIGTPLHFESRDDAENEMINALNSGDIQAFGRALHKFQDSYSHAGYSAPEGHILHTLVTKYDPDRYCEKSVRDTRMREATRAYLQMFNMMYEVVTPTSTISPRVKLSPIIIRRR